MKRRNVARFLNAMCRERGDGTWWYAFHPLEPRTLMSVVMDGEASVAVGETYQLKAMEVPSRDRITDWRVNWGDGDTAVFAADPDDPSRLEAYHVFETTGTMTVTASPLQENGLALADVSVLTQDPGFTAVQTSRPEYGPVLVRQHDGKFVCLGANANDSQLNTYTITRYNADGTIDTSFADNGVYTSEPSPFYARSMVLQDMTGDWSRVVVGGQWNGNIPGLANEVIDLTGATPGRRVGGGHAYFPRDKYTGQYLCNGWGGFVSCTSASIFVGGTAVVDGDFNREFALAGFKGNGDPDEAFGMTAERPAFTYLNGDGTLSAWAPEDYNPIDINPMILTNMGPGEDEVTGIACNLVSVYLVGHASLDGADSTGHLSVVTFGTGGDPHSRYDVSSWTVDTNHTAVFLDRSYLYLSPAGEGVRLARLKGILSGDLKVDMNFGVNGAATLSQGPGSVHAIARGEYVDDLFVGGTAGLFRVAADDGTVIDQTGTGDQLDITDICFQPSGKVLVETADGTVLRYYADEVGTLVVTVTEAPPQGEGGSIQLGAAPATSAGGSGGAADSDDVQAPTPVQARPAHPGGRPQAEFGSAVALAARAKRAGGHDPQLDLV